MNRTPSKKVQKILRKENGFTCCYQGCQSPYLEYHHFDPPWHIKNHHEPEGMIALCPNHHRKADAGVFNKKQLFKMKANAIQNFKNVKGNFDWMRRKFLLVAGGNFYFNNNIEISLCVRPLIWFNQDQQGYKLLNIQMFDKSNKIRLHIEDNIWRIKKSVKDIECPPSGKKLRIYFDNGDNIRLAFREITSKKVFEKLYPDIDSSIMNGKYPFSILKVAMKLNQYGINFQERKTLLNGKNGIIIKNCFMANNGVGLSL